MRRRPNGGLLGAYATSTSTTAPGCWGATEAALRKQGNAYGWPPSTGDANYASVVANWHFQTPAAAGAGFFDSTGNSHTISTINGTAAGDAGPSSAQVKWGTQSLYLDSGSAYTCSAATMGTAGAFGVGDFCVEVWIYTSVAQGASTIIVDTRPATPGTTVQPTFGFTSAGTKMNFYQNGAERITGTTTVTTGAWHHLAWSRSGTSTKAWLDGTQEGSTYTDSNNYTASNWWVGCLGNATALFKGYIAEMRVTKGAERYTSNFTAPTAPFPDF